jgi:hypothetical protein
VVRYQPCFRQWLTTHSLLAFLSPPPFSSVLSAFLPFLLCASFQLVGFVQVFFSGEWGVSLPRRLCWFIPGVAGGIPPAAWHSPVWSAKCLAGRFRAGGSGSPVFLV